MSATAVTATVTTVVTSVVTVTSTQAAKAITDTIYFESWVAIMSTFGLFNTLVGALIIGILGINRFILVAIVNSIGVAFAYGLAWVAYYGPYSTKTKVAASVTADVFWLMQEASLSFYSYFIVRTLIRGRERTIYLIVFWFLECAICGIRMPIIGSRVVLAKRSHNDPSLQTIINRLHMGYFISIALCESWNSYFLLKKFHKARTRRKSISHSSAGKAGRQDGKGKFAFRGGLYSQLARSSEIRLASLASVGIFRAVTFSFQTKAESATNFPTQLDHFAACVETMFSTVFIVDVLASKLAFQDQQGVHRGPLTDHSSRGLNQRRQTTPSEVQITMGSYQFSPRYDLEEMGSKGKGSTELKPIAMQRIDCKPDDITDPRSGNSRSDSL